MVLLNLTRLEFEGPIQLWTGLSDQYVKIQNHQQEAVRVLKSKLLSIILLGQFLYIVLWCIILLRQYCYSIVPK